MAKQTISVTSSAFAEGERIPERYTCKGDDVSPPLAWQGVPADAHGLVLIVDDPDAPSGTFTHWLLWGLPAGTKSLAENASRSRMEGAQQGQNDFGKSGYGGPCPPPGKPHHYRFQILALDRPIDLPAGVDRPAFDRAVDGHVLAQGTLVGLFSR